jgi:hypothetical protein
MLDRILATPQLARVVPQLQPELLHRLIRHCGLEDCGELVALATPGQVARLFDLDLWRPAAPGLDEQFDADRFGTWLEVMLDAGVSSAAATLAAMDVDLLAAGLVEHVRVFEYGAVASFITLDGELVPDKPFAEGVRSDIGRYLVTAKRTDFWDAMTGVLSALCDAHDERFSQVMRACCRLSSSRPEVDGLDHLLMRNDQARLDVDLDREARGDTHGYVTPPQARAFLQIARGIDMRTAAPPPRDPMTRAYFARIAAGIMGAHDRGPLEPAPHGHIDAAQQPPAEAVAAIVELLHEAGVLPRAPRALLEAPQTGAPRLLRIRAQLRITEERDHDSAAARNAELAYLANVVAAGASIQSRAVAGDAAMDAAIAVCNLGLENWPVHWLPGDQDLPEDFLIRNDLVSVFQVGWTVLHEDVCMYVADTLVNVLTSIHSVDADVQDGLEQLRTTLTRHSRVGTPWQARDALDVIAILDPPSWAALRGLIDQLPTMHAAVEASLARSTHRIEASAFEFISENAQIQQVHEFMRVLPVRLNG